MAYSIAKVIEDPTGSGIKLEGPYGAYNIIFHVGFDGPENAAGILAEQLGVAYIAATDSQKTFLMRKDVPDQVKITWDKNSGINIDDVTFRNA